MSLRRCGMRWLLLLAGDGQTRLRNRYKVSYLSLIDSPRTCCSRIHVNIECSTVNLSVPRLRKHDRRWKCDEKALSIAFLGLCSSFRSVIPTQIYVSSPPTILLWRG